MAEVPAGYGGLQTYTSDSTDMQLEEMGRDMAAHVCFDGIARLPDSCPCSSLPTDDISDEHGLHSNSQVQR